MTIGPTAAPMPQQECSQFMWRGAKCVATYALREASTAPAPRPYGTAQRTSCQKDLDAENPKSAIAVSPTEHAVRPPAPRRLTSRSVMRLDTMVPRQITSDIVPAADTAAPRLACMVGHAEPSRPSGRPRLTNAR